MKSDAIVGYTFNADQYHPGCLSLPTGPGEPYDGWALAEGVQQTAEENLDEIAAAFGIDRRDEGSFDSDDFPKVIFASSVESDDDVCGACGEPLIGGEPLIERPTDDDAMRALLTRALPMLIKLGDFIGNGPVDPQRPDSLGERCDLILDIRRHVQH